MKFGIYTFALQNPNFKLDLPDSILDLVTSNRFLERGWGNGYVLLPPTHPFHGADYYDLHISIHGGLTFGSIFESEGFLKWCEGKEFAGDVNLENFEKFEGYYMIGFDTGHLVDDMITCPKEYVLTEVDSLLEQCLSCNIEGIKKYKSIYSRKKKLKEINKKSK